jgi:pretoxin HINT domain-containing protein
VLATNALGQTGAFPVTDLIGGIGEKHFVRITAEGKTTVATLKHPYYLADEQRWIPAGSLSVGDRLRAADGSTIVAEAVSQFTILRAQIHNLTVAGAHTYYAGDEPVLVHNAKDCDGSDKEKSRDDDDESKSADRTKQVG